MPRLGCLPTLALLLAASTLHAAPMPPTEEVDLGARGVEILRADGGVDPAAHPRPLAGIAASDAALGPGWEDSAFITADGATLYFAYARIQAKKLFEDRPRCIEQCLHDCALERGGLPAGLPGCGPICSDPAHPAHPDTSCPDFIAGPDRPGQHGVQFDLYEARLDDGGFVVRNLGPRFNGGYPEAAAAAIPGAWLAFTRFREEELAPQVWGGDLYVARWDAERDRWGDPVPAPRADHRIDPTAINSHCREDNVHLVPRADGGLIAYWESDRNPDARPREHHPAPCLEFPRFWVAEMTGDDPSEAASWSAPVPVRLEGTDGIEVRTQLFVASDGAHALFTGTFGPAETGCHERACIFGLERVPGSTAPEGPFAGLTVRARATRFSEMTHERVLTFGDSSMTADGELLYFSYVEQCGDDDADPPVPCRGGPERWDVSIGVACVGGQAPCDRAPEAR